MKSLEENIREMEQELADAEMAIGPRTFSAGRGKYERYD